MLPDIFVALFLTIFLLIFIVVNVHNILWAHPTIRRERSYAEIQRPGGFLVNLGLAGTLIFFLEILTFSVLVFLGYGFLFRTLPWQLTFPLDSYIQIIGIIIIVFGGFLFLWSVIVRGRYAVSWEMTKEHRLVTGGPYRYVRHPSYLGYFLMFGGWVLLWLNLLALLPLIAIAAYLRISVAEEQLLTLRFGEKYKQYQAQTGRFFPRLHNNELQKPSDPNSS